jgi:hypothetical protein
MEAERRAALDAILDSDARKKLIVAGPGTGKTYTFKAALERAGGGVALTFIRALVRDLRIALAETAEIVNTFMASRSTCCTATHTASARTSGTALRCRSSSLAT